MAEHKQRYSKAFGAAALSAVAYLEGEIDIILGWIRLRDCIEAIVERTIAKNAQFLNMRYPPPKEYEYGKNRQYIVKEELNQLRLISSNYANRQWAPSPEKYREYGGLHDRNSDPTTEEAFAGQSQAILGALALEPERYEVRPNQIGMINLAHFPCRATPDMVVADRVSGEIAAVVEVKYTKNKSTLSAAKAQVCCQMVVWGVGKGCLVTKVVGEDRWVFTPYERDGSAMDDYTQSYKSTRYYREYKANLDVALFEISGVRRGILASCRFFRPRDRHYRDQGKEEGSWPAKKGAGNVRRQWTWFRRRGRADNEAEAGWRPSESQLEPWEEVPR